MADHDPTPHDPTPHDPPSSWSTPPATVLAVAAGAVAATVLALLTTDTPGRVLLALAAAGLGVVAVLGAVLRPRLTVDQGGLVVRGVRGSQRLDWPYVATLEVVATQRLGREVRCLEITPVGDDHTLLLLTRTDLGADPRDVLDRLVAVRAGR